MAEFIFDLLGDPIPPGFGKRGRPPHVVTDRKRQICVALLAFGKTEDDVAAALSITGPTLRKHYFRELKTRNSARIQVEAALMGKLMEESMEGNVSAIDKVFKRLDKHDQALVAARLSGFRKPDPLGKKDQARKDAKDMRGKYAPPEAPRLMN